MICNCIVPKNRVYFFILVVLRFIRDQKIFNRFASLALLLGLVSKVDFYNPVSILASGIQFASLMLTLNDLTKMLLLREKIMVRNNVMWFGQGFLADWIQMTV